MLRLRRIMKLRLKEKGYNYVSRYDDESLYCRFLCDIGGENNMPYEEDYAAKRRSWCHADAHDSAPVEDILSASSYTRRS